MAHIVPNESWAKIKSKNLKSKKPNLKWLKQLLSNRFSSRLLRRMGRLSSPGTVCTQTRNSWVTGANSYQQLSGDYANTWWADHGNQS